MSIAVRNTVAATHSAASATTVAATITATLAGSLIVVACGDYDAVTGRTVIGVTDNKGNTYNQAPNAAALFSAASIRTDIWFCRNALAGVTTITATFSGSAGTFDKTIWPYEVTGFSVAGFDLGSAANTQTGNGTDSSTAVITTSQVGFIVAVAMTSNGITANPKAANEFTSGGAVDASTGGAACSLISTTAASHQAQWSDVNPSNYCVSVAAFKESATLGGQQMKQRPGRPAPFKPMNQRWPRN